MPRPGASLCIYGQPPQGRGFGASCRMQGIRGVCGFGVARPDFQFAHYPQRSEEHTSELQSLMRISYAVFCLKKKNNTQILTQKISTSSLYNTITKTYRELKRKQTTTSVIKYKKNHSR